MIHHPEILPEPEDPRFEIGVMIAAMTIAFSALGLVLVYGPGKTRGASAAAAAPMTCSELHSVTPAALGVVRTPEQA